MKWLVGILGLMLVGCGFGMRPLASSGEPLPVDLAGLSTCDSQLLQTFNQGFRPFLLQNCAACHVPNGAGKGGFSSSDIGTAFVEFRLTTADKIADYAMNDAHQPPFSGSRHTAVVTGLESEWQNAELNYNSCVAGGGPMPTPTPTERWVTMAKAVTANTTPKVVAWNLATELIPHSGVVPNVGAARLEFTFRTTTTPVVSYQISSPRIVAGAVAYRVSDIQVIMNGQILNQITTYKSVDRRTPANANRVVSNSTMVIEAPVQATDTFSFTIGAIEPVDFAPPTFTQLRSAGGVFANSCNGCHSGGAPSAGLDVTNYNLLISGLHIVPFQTGNSPLLGRMKNTNFPMPPAGLLAPAQVKLVEDWILDGAPNN